MIKKRNWAFVLYPESAPEDWKEILKIKGLTFAVSPLHDKDINPTGEPKKEHYHIILCFDGPVTDKTVNDITRVELNQTIAIPLESVKGMYRYFTHIDNPEKYQYCASDIELYNGFDVTCVLNSMEVFAILKSLHTLILELGFVEYSELMEYLLASDLGDYYNVACSHTLYLNTLLTSIRHKKVKEVCSSKLPIIDRM